MSGNVIPGLTRDLLVRGDPRSRSEGDRWRETEAGPAPDRGTALPHPRYRTLWQPRTFALRAQRCRQPKRRPVTPEACRFSMAHLRCDGPVRRWHGGRCRDLDSVLGKKVCRRAESARASQDAGPTSIPPVSISLSHHSSGRHPRLDRGSPHAVRPSDQVRGRRISCDRSRARCDTPAVRQALFTRRGLAPPPTLSGSTARPHPL